MYIKKWLFDNSKLDLHTGINVVYNTNGYDLLSIATFLSQVCKHKYGNSVDQSCLEIVVPDSNHSCQIVCGDTLKSFNCYYKGSKLNHKDTMEQKDYKDFIDSIDYDIFVFYNKGYRPKITFINKFQDYNKYKLTAQNFYFEAFSKSYFVPQQYFWGNYFINNDLNGNEVTEFHCYKLKQIINEIIQVANYHDFEFSYDNNYFVVKYNGQPQFIQIRVHQIGQQIGLMMKLYWMFLSKGNNIQFCSQVETSKGIVVTNMDFGERPSYSDNKWKYYDIWKKYFPNIQFIVL